MQLHKNSSASEWRRWKRGTRRGILVHQLDTYSSGGGLSFTPSASVSGMDGHWGKLIVLTGGVVMR